MIIIFWYTVYEVADFFLKTRSSERFALTMSFELRS